MKVEKSSGFKRVENAWIREWKRDMKVGLYLLDCFALTLSIEGCTGLYLLCGMRVMSFNADVVFECFLLIKSLRMFSCL